MEAGRSESRFLLPNEVEAVLALDAADRWRVELTEFGVQVSERAGSTPPDLTVCPPHLLDEAIASGAASIVVEGTVAGRRLVRAGYGWRRYLAAPSYDRPQAYVPLGRPGPAGYALLTWMGADRRWKQGRNRVLAAAMTMGRLNVPGRTVTIASRDGSVPWLVTGATALGTPRDADWILAPAQGDRLSRGVFLVFPRDEASPSHVVKFARVPGWSEPFELDEAALKLLDDAGEVVTRHVPQVLGRATVGGLATSVETAALGQRMIGFLHTPAAPSVKRRVIDSIAAWLMDLARATQSPPDTLEFERARLARDLAGGEHGADARSLIDAISAAPGVLQHNDLGTWNVAVDDGEFTVLDWESARRHGLPLWDLWYFLMDAEAHLAGADGSHSREQHFADLFGGRLPASDFLFQWTLRLAEAHGIPRAALGPLATLCWLHHGLSGAVRREELARTGQDGESAPWLGLLERLRERWLADPELGPGWAALARR